MFSTRSNNKKWRWYVYILECLDGSYYVGMTWKPELRFEQHLSRLGGEYTKKHGVKKLAYLEEYEQLELARNREIQVKSWSRKKKQKLINGEWKQEW